MASSGYCGYCGYFQESEQSCGFAGSRMRGYFVDFLVTRGFIRGRCLIGERPGVPNARARHTHPRHPGDIGDIGDIFRKAAKTLGFLHVHTGDISGDIFGDWDFHTQDTLACACFVDAIGEPLLRTVRAASVCRPAGNPSGSTYEAPTVSVLATVRHFRTVATAVIDAGKCVSGERTRNPPHRAHRSSLGAS